MYISLRFGTGAVEAVTHEYHALHASRGSRSKCVSTLAEAGRNVGPAVGVNAIDALQQARSNVTEPAQGLQHFARIGVADKGNLVVVLHVGNKLTNATFRFINLLALHRA
jgi:hypothetical protein